VSRAMGAKWLLSRAGESGAVAMDVKWLLGRADESGATAVSRGQVRAECFRTPILSLLTRLPDLESAIRLAIGSTVPPF